MVGIIPGAYERELLRRIHDSEAITGLWLGGSGGPEGGTGLPPGGFIGQLVQTQVAYDTSEAELSSGSASLLDNLNHIRKRIADLESYGTNNNSANILFEIGGRLAVRSEVGAYISTGSMVLNAVYIRCASSGSAGSTIVDVNKNGTTVFTTQANRPTLAYNDADGIAKSGVPEVSTFVENDIITIDIDQVADEAADLTVVLDMGSESTGISSGSTFLSLTDTPSGFGGAGGYLLRVDSTPDAVEFVDINDIGVIRYHEGWISSGSAQTQLGSLPNPHMVLEARVWVNAVPTSGSVPTTNAELHIGHTSGSANYVADIDVTTTGAKADSDYTAGPDYREVIEAARTLTAQLSYTGSPPTNAKIHVLVKYALCTEIPSGVLS